MGVKCLEFMPGSVPKQGPSPASDRYRDNVVNTWVKKRNFLKRGFYTPVDLASGKTAENIADYR